MLKINSNFKKLFKSFLILGLFGFSIQALATWVAPTSAPVGGNTPSPVHVGSDTQYKIGGLLLGGLRVLGGTLPTAIFDGKIQILGGSPGDGKVLTSDVDGVATWEDLVVGGDSLWVRTGQLLSPLNPNDDIGISNSAVFYKGGNTFLHNYGTNNTFLGINAGNLSMSGTGQNTAIGKETMFSNTTGNQNTAIGFQTLYDNTTGAGNTAIGWLSLTNNTTGGLSGGGNTGVGISSLFSNTTGNQNVGIGQGALYDNTTGGQNTAVGTSANVSAGNLTNATAIGFSANVNASNKVRIGNSSVTVYETQVPWTTGSDFRLKKNIQDIDLGLDFISNLRPVSYQMKTDTDESLSYGFIAQEVEKVLGDRKTKLVNTQNDSEQMKYLRYNDLMAPMVKAIQEQQIQIEELKKEIEILKAK